MFTRGFFAFLLILSATGMGQSLQDINYRYLYDPSEPVRMVIKPVRTDSTWHVVAHLFVNDSSLSASDFIVQWETRQSLASATGDSLAISLETTRISEHELVLFGTLPELPVPAVLVAKAIYPKQRRAWIFFQVLSANYPVNTFPKVNGTAWTLPYVPVGASVHMVGNDPFVVSYYNDDFPPGIPAFAEAQGQVARSMQTDSTFIISPGEDFQPRRKGLYLVQRDTTARRGLSFRAEQDYPKLSHISSLSGPFVYVSTKQENDRFQAARNDKKAFDRALLNLMKDAERAKRFMRNYFKRVQVANAYFTSYKEGWKTDRGLIFIIFGLPDEVLKTEDREVWAYKDGRDTRFVFVKASSVFDPDNFVLLRDKKYQQLWYETVDLWRNARF